MSNVIPPIPPYFPPWGNIPSVTPFTHRDGLTNMEVLEDLRRKMVEVVNYVNTTSDPALANAFTTEVNRLITEVNEAVAAQLTAQNEAVAAQIATIETEAFNDPVILNLIADVNSQTRQLLDTLYAGGGAGGATDTDVNAIVSDDESDTRATLDTLYTFDDADLNDIVSDSESVTRVTLDGLYLNPDVGTDSDVAGYVIDPESLTRAALDGLYTGGGGGTGGIPITPFVEVTNAFYPETVTEVRSVIDRGGVAHTVFSNAVAEDEFNYSYASSSAGAVWDVVTPLVTTATEAFPILYMNDSTIHVNIADVVYTSSDGITWDDNPANVSGISTVFWSEIANAFIGAQSNALYSSVNGYTWTLLISQGASYPLASMVAGTPAEFNGKIIIPSLAFPSWPPAANPSSCMLTSTDGSTWVVESVPQPIENNPYALLAEFDGALYAISTTSPSRVMMTGDGTAWNALDDLPFSAGNAFPYGDYLILTEYSGMLVAKFTKDLVNYADSLVYVDGAPSSPPQIGYGFMPVGNRVFSIANVVSETYERSTRMRLAKLY